MAQPLQFAPGKPSCSNCGDLHQLHLVTCAGPGSRGPGRTLVYCAECRIEHQHTLDVSIPTGLLTRELLIGLYASGKTTSDPEIMLDLILGLTDPDLGDQLRDALM